MPIVLQLYLVMMSKYSKFGVDNFNTFWVLGNLILKFLHDDDNNNNDHLAIASFIHLDTKAKNGTGQKNLYFWTWRYFYAYQVFL